MGQCRGQSGHPRKFSFFPKSLFALWHFAESPFPALPPNFRVFRRRPCLPLHVRIAISVYVLIRSDRRASRAGCQHFGHPTFKKPTFFSRRAARAEVTKGNADNNDKNNTYHDNMVLANGGNGVDCGVGQRRHWC
jgi:hypothetical protein